MTLLSEGPSGHSPVQRAGLVLLALTPEEQLPMQLRLLTLEEVSPRPRLSTLKDLHRELEFFERPDRQSIVREVYERFQPQSSPAAVESAVPAPLLEPPPPKRHHRWWKGRSVWVGSMIVLLGLAAAALVWAWPRPEGQWLRTNASQLTQASLDAGRKAVQAVRNEMKSAKWQLGFRPRGPEPSVLSRRGRSDLRAARARQDITLEGGASAPEVPPFRLAKTPLSGAPEPGTRAAGTWCRDTGTSHGARHHLFCREFRRGSSAPDQAVVHQGPPAWHSCGRSAGGGVTRLRLRRGRVRETRLARPGHPTRNAAQRHQGLALRAGHHSVDSPCATAFAFVCPSSRTGRGGRTRAASLRLQANCSTSGHPIVWS